MRINPKAYELANDVTPIEVQEFDSKVVELYNLNDFEGLKEEFVYKGKFAVWSSVDSVNYRLYIEEGYYAELKELYSQPINKIWIDFWDACEKVTKKTSSKIILPITFIAVILCILTGFIPNQDVSLYLMIGIVVASFGGMIFVNRWSKKRIYEENQKSVDLIKKHLGEKKFEKLLEKQKEYMDKYFENLYPEDEEDFDEEVIEEPTNEETSEEVIEEPNTEETLEEVIEDPKKELK